MESKIVDQRKLSTEYLEQHKVLKLFNILGSRLAKEKPDDPNEFLLQELTTILDLKNAKLPVSIF